MAIPLSRLDFKEYCLRRLGKPVIRINVEDGQVEDRIDDAIQKYQEQHYDAVQETWVAYSIKQADVDVGYIEMPADILIVSELINLGEALNGNDMFSHQYQFALQNLSPFQSLDTINYYMTMTNMQSVYDMVNAAPRLQHTRHMNNRVELFQNLGQMGVGTILAFRVFKTIDPQQYVQIYNDMWLKKYATALIKMQWGNNMKKHGEVQLLGGVSVNGQQIYDESLTEVEKLEEELETKYSLPVDFFMG